MKQDANAVTLEYVNRWGDHHTLALYRDSYAMGGGFAISALDATDPADSEYLSPWSDITVNIPDNPDAAWWCATEKLFMRDIGRHIGQNCPMPCTL